MRRAAHPPKPPDLPTQLESEHPETLAHDSTHAELEWADLALSDQQAKGVTLRALRCAKVDLSGSRLDHLALADGALVGCNLANVQARKADFARVTVETSRLTGLALPEATLSDVTLRDCRIDLASFGFSRLARVTFEDCLLTQADFLEAQLEDVRFHRCDLTGADFRGAHLHCCEFRRSTLADLQGVPNLRGAALEWSDIVELAGVWAAALGIDVLDVD